MRRGLAVVMAAWMGSLAIGARAADAGLIRIDGAIGPATANYIARALEVARQQGDGCLIIQLDTPGGLLSSTEDIIKSFYAETVPTIVYVAPSGAKAASAGCFITLAANVAAMAPFTTIGAAHPVSIGGGGEEKTDEVMKKKLENAYGSYIEDVAKKRGHNPEWARAAVEKSESLTAEKALDMRVIDLIAKDIPDLLQQVDGREVNGKPLKTAGAKVVEIPMIASEKIFQLLWRPEVLMILTLAAIYGIIGELSNPGAILPGVVGGIALILVLYMSAVLPVNIAGLALIGLAVLLFIADVYAPTHGVLTIGGIAAFFLGSLMLFNQAEPGFRLSLTYIIPATAVTALFFIFVVGAGLRAQLLPVRSGREAMLGRIAPALAQIDSHSGRIFIEGEYWNAISDTTIPAGSPAEIIGVNGLTLKVKPKQS